MDTSWVAGMAGLRISVDHHIEDLLGPTRLIDSAAPPERLDDV
jgi:hypothetical protein